MANDDSKRDGPPGPASVSRVWLRFGEHELELPPGETLIGRSPGCRVVLDDPLVSRTHARMVVLGGTVTVEDLGSANGVIVNGERLKRARALASDDQMVIGQQTFQIFVREGRAERPGAHRLSAQTLSGQQAFMPASLLPESDRSEATRKGDALDLLIGVAEKVLALGRGEEAERIISTYLRNLLQVAQKRGEIDVEVAEKAAAYALRIAEATGKGTWADYVFELYVIVKRPLPAPVVERLYASLRKLTPVSVNVFRQYLSVLRSVEPGLGPADRFLMRRIEGLESLGALR